MSSDDAIKNPVEAGSSALSDDAKKAEAKAMFERGWQCLKVRM